MRNIVLFSLEGRIGRRVYSVVVAAYLVLMMAVHLIAPIAGTQGWYAFLGFFVLASAMLVGMSVRRLHDFGQPGTGALWTALPLCESAAVIGLASGRAAVGLETTRPYVLFVATAVFAAWGVVGTAWLMRRRGDEGDNAYGPPAGAELPRILVAGGGTVGLVGAKAVAYGSGDRPDAKSIRRGRPSDVPPGPRL